ncbi:TRAP transporter substrate-binding protein [Brevibacillus massiliensis]|jgi:tripartite ATP-independent transporter DctP family solute receptor|uniref:TRAP transporter substrate-binding protein n=1 Tax=Brevibacillus massiliensis TaxID=1118054 RepID=UPI0002FC5B94|nr:TRAP transporter substrate-binding protein [Brevibacillus massiliensis]
MRKFKLLTGILSTTLVLTALAGCSGGGSSEPAGGQAGEQPAQTIQIKLAHTGSETHQYHIGAEIFKKELESLSNNTIKVNIHPNATLGNEKDAVEGVMNGIIDMSVQAAESSFANVVPEMNVFGIPFLFKDSDHVYKVLDGDIGKSLLQKADEKGMKALGFWEVGFRNMTTKSTPINTPADMKGLKVRVQPAPVWQEFMKSLGANPTPVEFNELYSALEQGTVDGQENPIATIMSMKFYEVQKQLALTAHTYTPAVVIMSNKAYNSLNDEQKQWVAEAVQKAAQEQRKILSDKEAQSIEELKQHGVNITEPDRAAFAEATSGVAKVLADKVPQELIDQIKAAAE